MNFEIRTLTEDEFSLWDELVDGASNGTIFHKTFWLKASGREFVIYGYFKGGELFAGIPLTYHRKWGFKIATQPALTPYSGIIFKNLDTKYVNRLSQEKMISCETAKVLKQKNNLIKFNFPPGSPDLQPFIWEGFSTGIRYTYIISLESSLEDIWNSMDNRRRNDIRKAERDGLIIIPSDDFTQTFKLVEKTFARQTKDIQFKKNAFSYNKILGQRKQCKSFLTKNKDGEAIAVVYIIWDNQRSYYLLGGYDTERSHHGASALAMWEAIKFSKEILKLKEFDFEGSMIPQVEQFFRKFGGKFIPYYIVSKYNPAILGIAIDILHDVKRSLREL